MEKGKYRPSPYLRERVSRARVRVDIVIDIDT